MSKEEKNNLSPNKFTRTIIELDDNSGYFLSYWNLAIKKHLSNYFCSFDLEKYFSVKHPLSAFNISISDINNSIIENLNPLIFEEKLFSMKIHFLSSEKELNADFIQSLKQSYGNNKLNLILYLINEIKEKTDILKDSQKLLNKIKSKCGNNDITILPYNIVYFEQLQPAFSIFLEFFTEKFTKEYLNKMEKMTKIMEKYENDNKEENYDNYQFMENMIYYFDLLSLINRWDFIQKYCTKFLFKELKCFTKENNNLKPMSFSNYELNRFKLNFKNKKIGNIEFQEFILNYYIKSLQFLEEYTYLVSFIKIIPYKMNLFIKNFKTEYHYLYWILNYYYNLIDYFNSLNNFPNTNTTSEALLYLYSNSVKFLKLYAYKANNIYIPNNRILIEILNCIKDKDFEKIGERLKHLIDEKAKIENNELKMFIDEFNNKEDALFIILNDNKKFLEEILSLLNCINKNTQEYINFHISINCVFDIVYLLIFFCKFNEAKNILVPLLNYKFLKKQKIKYVYEYICFILLLIMNFIDKNFENLNLVFKLLNINYTNIGKILKNLNWENKNMIYEIISNYLDSSDLKKIEEEINFSLDTVFNIKFFEGQNKTLFVNKTKNESQKLDYKITNNTGIKLNISKVNLIFEENDINNDNLQNNKKISYSINNDKNEFKILESFIKEKNEFFCVEFTDIFKLNNKYKLIEIQYELNNSIKGIYHIKENIELIFNELNINIKSEIFSSYDNSYTKNNFYYNILCKFKINIMNISDVNELKDKSLLIQIFDLNKNDDSILKIQTELLKSFFKEKISEIIVDDLSIEFPPNSIKNINDINNLEIPFFFENTNYYTNNKKSSIKIKINIKDNNNKNLFSYSENYNIKYIHLFTIGKRFKLLKNNTYLLQTFLSLNLETTKVKVYNSNSTTNIDSKQAINMILLLNDKENDILLKLRNNFMTFSLNNEDNIKYRFCYPEKNILDEIKEMKEIPYHIIISVDNNQNNNFDLLKEIYVNICIKKYKEKSSKLMIKINDNNNWCTVGKNKIIEDFGNEKSEKNIKIALLPLIDGFLQLPEIEFSEYEKDSDLNFIEEDKNDNNEEYIDFEPIEYGSIIEGEKNVLKIRPSKEYNLKINLT